MFYLWLTASKGILSWKNSEVAPPKPQKLVSSTKISSVVAAIGVYLEQVLTSKLTKWSA